MTEPRRETLTPEQQQRERDDIAMFQRRWDEYLRQITGGPPTNGDRFRRFSWLPIHTDPLRY